MTIRFTSEHQVQITIGGDLKGEKTYEDLGFAKKKSESPNRAWEMLQDLAKGDGRLQLESVRSGKELLTGQRKGQTRNMTQTGIVAVRTEQTRLRSGQQKRIQELRKILRGYFRTDADPVPFVKGEYTTAFRIERSSAFDL